MFETLLNQDVSSNLLNFHKKLIKYRFCIKYKFNLQNNKISLFSKICRNRKVPKVKMKVKTNQTKIQVIQNYLKERRY